MSWIIAEGLVGFEFEIHRDPIGSFPSKAAACDHLIEGLERQRRDLARAIRKAKRMRRRAKP